MASDINLSLTLLRHRVSVTKAQSRIVGGAIMAGSVNKVILIGNLGADPEVRTFQNGGKVANLRIATSETWKDKNTGERREKTEWHTVAIFQEGLIGVVERFLRK